MELLPLVCLCLLSCSGDAVRVVVEEDSDAVLPCLISTKEDITGKLLVWKKDGQKQVFTHDTSDKFSNRDQDEQFKGRVSFFQDQLKNGNASIKITGTKMADSGTYSCDFPKLQPSQTSTIELVVGRVLKDRTGENIPGAASKPSVKTIKTDDGVMLQCEVLGASPKPKVEWKDSSGNILPVKDLKETERGGSYNIVLRAALTKTDTFSCVVTQEEISHQISDEIYAVSGAASEPYVRTIQTDDGVMLQCEVVGASPKPKVEWKDSSENILQAEEPQVTERGGSYNIVLQAAVTKTDTFRCVVTQEEISHQIYAETYASVSGSNTVAIVGGVFGGAALMIIFLVVVIIILCYKLRDKKKSDAVELKPADQNSTTEPLKHSDHKLTSSACAMKFSAVCVSTMLDDGEDILSALLLFQTV
ncbi:uncharacterized protein AB9X84_009653 [Acanthopagrus schlegelii]